MSSFRCLRKFNKNVAATVAFVVAATAASSALAQSPPRLPTAAEASAAAGQSPVRLPGAAPVAASPGLDVKLPEGANISDADQQVRALAAEAGRDLEELLGASLTEGRENNTQKTNSARQIQLMELDHKIQVATKTKELWTILNGEDSEKESQIKELETKLETLQTQNDQLSKRADAALRFAGSGGGAGDPDPVVAQVSGAAGNLTAEVLVPYTGKFLVRRGDTLPNGMKIVSVSSNGVTVEKEGEKRPLSFGSAVPMLRQGPRS